MKPKKQAWLFLPLLAFSFFLANTGCDGKVGGITPNPPNINKSLRLLSYESCNELETEIKEMLIGEMEANLDNYKAWCRYEWDDRDSGPSIQGGEDEAAPTAFNDQGAEATGTNVQEQGVDEADLIKTDGQYTFAVINNEVIVVKVWPFDDFGQVATIKPDGQPKGLYLASDKLIVLAEKRTEQQWNEDFLEANPYTYTIDYTTYEEVYDVSLPHDPKLIKRQAFSGSLLASRRIDSTLYLIIEGQGVVHPAFDYDLDIDYNELPLCSASGEVEPNEKLLDAIERLKQKNHAMVNNLTLADLMLNIGKDIGCSQIARSSAASGTTLLTVASDDFTNAGALATKSAIMSNGGTVYASRYSLYVTSSTMMYGWWSIPEYDFADSTVIHRFALPGGEPMYTGSAEVEGHLVDNAYVGSRYSTRFSMAQFAMSEYEGFLRVATTVNTYTSMLAERDNRVVILNAGTPDLEKVGEVKGMGGGERIYSVRFIGPRGYVVTFKKVDPLYVLDLSNPAAPEINGELKIPGFSTYLHPLGEDHIIGLGFGADDMGDFAWTQGLKLALFDISDPSNPIEVGNREIGSRGSYSAAIEEHHAFTLDPNRGMLALPVDIYEGGMGGSDYGEHSFSGVMLLDVDLSGSFNTIGQIVIDESGGYEPMWWSDSTNVLRTVILGDGDDEGVITLTDTKLYLNRIDEEMSVVGSI